MTDHLPANLTRPQLRSAIEGLLFIGAGELNESSLAKAFAGFTPVDFQAVVAAIASSYQRQNRPYEIVHNDTGWNMCLTAVHAGELQRKRQTERGVELPRATVEVLSMVAYRQPISKSEIEDRLGVDAAVHLRSLVRRRLIGFAETEGKKPPAQSAQYVTTDRFLELFNLESLADLPATDDSL